MSEKPNFETALAQLQGIVKTLESGELSLEQSLKNFEEGIRLTRLCQEHLSAVEQRVEQLTQVDGKLGTQPFQKT